MIPPQRMHLITAQRGAGSQASITTRQATITWKTPKTRRKEQTQLTRVAGLDFRVSHVFSFLLKLQKYSLYDLARWMRCFLLDRTARAGTVGANGDPMRRDTA